MSLRFLLPLRVAVLCAIFANAASANDPLPGEDLDKELTRIPPKEPAEALRTFQVRDNFRMDLIASEPVVTDPIASVIDENGRMYVVEMRGYPYPEKMGSHPIGNIRLLEDKDDDGTYETSTIFASELSWPTGIELWKGGVYVTVAPDVWYFKDTDGDGKADVKERLYTGFEKHNVQGLLNNLKWGLDHKIHGASGSNGGEVTSLKDPGADPVSVRGNDFTIDPVTGKLEAISGSAQFGNSFDDYGNRFVCSNSDHAQQMILPRRYLARNPYLAVPQVKLSIAAEGGAGPVFRTSQAEPWRIVRTRRRAASGQQYAATELVPIGFFTSASGITVYRGSAYGREYRGNLFIGDVGGNLIHRKTLTDNGIPYLAKREDQNTEFVTSSDNWFRPVNFTNAPDGTLHVLDMYRETIEHPASIPEDIKAHLDLESGRDRGRIYRLTPPGYKWQGQPKLGNATTPELVAFLKHPNAWNRDTAHRLLYERQDKSAAKEIRDTILPTLAAGKNDRANDEKETGAGKKSESEYAAGQLSKEEGKELLLGGKGHTWTLYYQSDLTPSLIVALWTLQGLDELTDEVLLAALRSAPVEVQIHAIRLAEPRLAESRELFEAVARLAESADPRVRMQVAFSMGEVPDAPAAKVLAKIARKDAGDPWIRTAILSSSTDLAGPIASQLIADPEFGTTSPQAELLGQLAFIIGARSDSDGMEDALGMLKKRTGPSDPNQRIVSGLLDGLKRVGGGLDKLTSERSRKLISEHFETAKATATDDTKSEKQRLGAIELLGFGQFADVQETLAGLLDPKSSTDLLRATIRALSSYAAPDVADALLVPWAGYTPPIRAEVTEILLGRPEWAAKFLDAIEAGDVAANQIPPNRKALLLEHPNAELKSRAMAILGNDAPSPRADVLATYAPALKKAGDPDKGAKVFERECMTCHKLGDKGQEVGPNLATIQNRTTESLMQQILDPNREVLPNYLDYIVLVDDGRVITGIIAGESASSITLRRAQKNEDVILRQNIEEIKSSGKSLMPEGLEKKITPDEMADLLAFLLSGIK